MRYLPLTPEDRSEMLARIGARDIDELHHLAHEGCFIANSVKSEVVVQGAMSFA